jgi:hypothetical protein
MMRGIFAAVCILACSGVARAEDPHLLLHRGIQLHREASYATSVAALEQARQSGLLDGNEQVECAFYLAADYVAMSSMQAARRELRTVLEEQPNYELPPYTSPKVAALFHDVLEELERLPRLRALPPRRKGSVVELWFEPSRTGGTAWGGAQWRFRGEGTWHEAPMVHFGEQLMAVVPIDRNGTLEYWAQARGPQGLAEVASAKRPLELPISGYKPAASATAMPLVVASSQKEKKSIAKAWWLWTTVGAVAAAGLGVGLYYGLRPPTGGTADAVLDFKVQ